MATTKEAGPKPQVQMVKMYDVTIEGKAQRLTEAEYQAQRARAIKNILFRLELIEGECQSNRTEHKIWMKEVHGEHWYSVGSVSDIVGGVVPLPDSMWTRPAAPIANGRKAAQEGRLDAAARQLTIANDALRDVKKEWHEYLGKTIEGAQTTAKGLEVTRDVSFAIAISAATIVAAPVVVGAVGTGLGAGGVGLTGTALTATTFAGSAAVVTVGGGVAGGVLRGGTNVAGQALTGDKINTDQALSETWKGAKRGAVDAGSAFVGGAVSEIAGVAKAANLTQKVVRGAAGGTAGGAFGGGLNATLEGKDLKDIAKETVVGGASGLVGGGLSAGVGHVLPNASPLVQNLAGGVVGGGVTYGVTRATGGTHEEALDNALISGVQGLAMGGAGNQKGFGFGKGGSELQGRFGKRTAEEPARPQLKQPLKPEQEVHTPEKPKTTSEDSQTQAEKQHETKIEEPPAKAEAEQASKPPEPKAEEVAAAAPKGPAEEPAPGKTLEKPKTAAEAEEHAFTKDEVDKYIEDMFAEMQGQPDRRAGVESERVKGGKIEDKRVPIGELDATGEAQRSGPRKADGEDVVRLPGETMRQAVARVNQARGKAIADTPLKSAWDTARAKVLKGRTVESLGAKGALRAYKKTQQEFWKAVRKDPAAVQFLKDTGHSLPPGNGAAVLDVNPPPPGKKALIIEERRLSLDHSAEKAIGENWKLALDGDKLILEYHRVNSFRDSIQRALKIGAYTPKPDDSGKKSN